MSDYNPFAAGPFPVGVRTAAAHDTSRDRLFPVEIWYPALEEDGGRDVEPLPAPHPLIVFSHSSGGHRRSATYLCTHLASHGFAVAAMDHSEVVDPALGRSNTEAAGGQKERIDAIVDARVPDVRFLLDYLLAGRAGVHLDAASVGLVGHSFGGWTVLATLEEDPRVGAVVALAPGGSRHPLPGILPLTLTFSRRRSVPALYLAAENDVPIPPTAVIDVFERTPGPKRLFILQRADHQHFADYVESEHEALRAMSLPGDAAWIPRTMRPMEELCSGEQAHLAVRGLTLAHLDATLHGSAAAEAFLSGDVEARLASQGVETLTRRSLDR